MTATLTVVPRIVEGTSVGKMKRSKITKTVKQFVKMENKIRFDLAIQRNNVWSDQQKSMLIHSLLEEYPVPLFFVKSSDDGFLWMLDGRQRGTTILDYVAPVGALGADGKERRFALDKDTPPVMVEKEVIVDNVPHTIVEMVEVEGKFFSDLPEELQEQIMGYSLDIIEMKNITDEQVEELFQRLNSGSPLTAMELTRALSGSATMEFVQELSSNPFFKQYANISVKGRNRYVDHELIMQVIMLLMGRKSGISSKEIKEFAQDLRQLGISDAMKNEMFETTMYMENVFRTLSDDEKKNKTLQNKILKKIHIPMLFLAAKEAMQAGVSVEAFRDWAVRFLHTEYKVGGTYGGFCGASTAKVAQVTGRKEAMLSAVYKEFGITPVVDNSTSSQDQGENENGEEGNGNGNENQE